MGDKKVPIHKEIAATASILDLLNFFIDITG
jgi:hypothetical protein